MIIFGKVRKEPFIQMQAPFKLFDRYILGIFIKQLIFSMLAATTIFIVVDLVENVDSFIDKSVPVYVLIKYYGYFLPYIFYLVLPVGILLSTLFTLGGLSRNHELTAMKASGISLHRVMLHLMFFGILFSGWNFIFGETIVPMTNKRNKDIYRYYVKGVNPDQAGRQGNVYLRNNPGELLHIKYFDPAKDTAFDMDWQKFKGEVMMHRIIATKAVWRDSGWVAEQGKEWFFQDNSIQFRRIDQPRTFDDLGFVPADLIKVQTAPEEMGYWQLKRFVERLQMMGGDPLRWMVELAFKLSMPWTCAIVILIGVPIAAHHRRSGVTLAFGIGLFISFLFFALQRVGQVMGFNGLMDPGIAAWIGNVTFIIVGLVMYVRVEK
ncbi:MAG: LptF/LptG family permease [bacterium]